MVDSFAKRHGYESVFPERVKIEQDSPRLRALIWSIVSNDGNSPKHGYQTLCGAVGMLPDPNTWGDSACSEAAAAILEDVAWVETYEIVEHLYSTWKPTSGTYARTKLQDAVNDALERSGLAYEMRDGRIELFDFEATSLGIQGSESEALELLTDEFASVRKQYANAVAKLNRRPIDLEGAVADALNSLEAVVAIVMSEEGKTLGDLSGRLFPDGAGYHKPLRDAIGKLYGYASALPGARHGRYAEPMIAAAETAMVLRIVGSMMAFVITDHRVGTIDV